LLLGMLCIELGKSPDALAFLARARRRCLEAGEPEIGILATYETARACRQAGDDEQAESLARSCLDLARATGKTAFEAATLHFIGRVVKDRSLAEAEDYARQALACINRDDPIYGSVLADLGEIAWQRGDPDQAYQLLTEAATALEAMGLLEEFCGATYKLAVLCIESWELDQAATLLRAVTELSQKLGDVGATVHVLHELGILEQRRGNVAEAERSFRAAARSAAVIGDRLARALAYYHLGWIELGRGRIGRAAALERRSSAILEDAGNQYFFAHNLQLRAALCLYHGQIMDGRHALEQALELSDRLGDVAHVANCRGVLNELDRSGVREGMTFRLVPA